MSEYVCTWVCLFQCVCVFECACFLCLCLCVCVCVCVYVDASGGQERGDCTVCWIITPQLQPEMLYWLGGPAWQWARWSYFIFFLSEWEREREKERESERQKECSKGLSETGCFYFFLFPPFFVHWAVILIHSFWKCEFHLSALCERTHCFHYTAICCCSWTGERESEREWEGERDIEREREREGEKWT